MSLASATNPVGFASIEDYSWPASKLVAGFVFNLNILGKTLGRYTYRKEHERLMDCCVHVA
jgi:hypothetical protein